MISSIFLVVLLTLLNAVFAAAEIAVLSMNETKLRTLTEEGNKRAVKLSRLTQQPARFLATIQVAITLAGFLNSAFASDYFAPPLVNWLIGLGVPVSEQVLNPAAVVVITLILSYFSLIFGELVPKRIAMKKADSLSLALAGLLHAVAKATAPLVSLLSVSTNGVLRLLGIDPNEADEQVTEEEIRMMLSEGSQQGTIDKTDSEMIKNIFNLDDLSAEQICTHRIDVTLLNIEDDLCVWEDTIFQSRYTYYPVYRENTDNIVGVLDTKDYFRTKERTKEALLETALDAPWFVPENTRANVLFQNMKNTGKYFAVLIDEYGGMSGILTLHDLIETLVGDLYDFEDTVRIPEIRQISETTWKISGSALLLEVAEVLNLPLPTDTFDTYGGYICDIIGRVPANGEAFSCETENLKIQVHTVINHRIGETTVTKKDTVQSSER